jgi:hypothetical protein
MAQMRVNGKRALAFTIFRAEKSLRINQLKQKNASWRSPLAAGLSKTTNDFNLSLLAGELGFEPRQTESESVVLPLHHSPSKRLV